MIISYNEIIEIRRKNNASLFYEQDSSGEYLLQMNYGAMTLECELRDSGDIADFEANRKQFCNKAISPDAVELRSHDFSTSGSWIHGTNNSVFSILPSAGKVLKPQRFLGQVDKSAVLNAGQDLMINFWQTVDGTACPAYVSGVKTAFGSPLYNPPTTQTGWYKYYPTDGSPQEVEVWLYMDNNAPKYKVSSFKFTSLVDIMHKSEYQIVGNRLNMKFDYHQYDIGLSFCSSLNERIEIYLANDTAINKPNSEDARVSIMFHSFDEW